MDIFRNSFFTLIKKRLLNCLKVIGDPYFDLDVTRLRFFGGSSNHWTGMCRSFEKVDFERKYLGNIYQWPIKFNDIDKYKKKACEILEIPSEFDDNIDSTYKIKSIGFNIDEFKTYMKHELDVTNGFYVNNIVSQINSIHELNK